MPRKEILYFNERGEVNLEETLKIVKERAEELDIKDIVIASTRGTSALKALEMFPGFNVVIVPHVTGSREPGKQRLSENLMDEIQKKGGKLVIAAHAFSGVNSAIHAKWNTMYPAGIIAQTLRMLGQGMKVVVEIASMAADAGVIPVDKDIVVVAGSGRGADTAVVLRASNSKRIFETEIKEIIAKPRNP
jgi:hypothetical protein